MMYFYLECVDQISPVMVGFIQKHKEKLVPTRARG
jgi:hypothetical protein